MSSLRRVLYLGGGLLLLFVAYVAFHPDHGTTSRAWPWELFAAGFLWDSPRAQATTTLLFAVFSLVLACLHASRGRGVVALVAAGVLLAVAGGEVALPGVGAALAVGGTLALGNQTGGPAARWVLVAGLAVLATQILLPLPVDDAIPLASLQQSLTEPEEGRSWIGTLTSPANLILEAELLVFVVGLLSLLGVPGRWAGIVALLSLAVLALGVPLRAAIDAGREAETPEGLRAAAETVWARGSAVMAWIVAGVIDVRKGAPLVR